jgi:hypothetical protein
MLAPAGWGRREPPACPQDLVLISAGPRCAITDCCFATVANKENPNMRLVRIVMLAAALAIMLPVSAAPTPAQAAN